MDPKQVDCIITSGGIATRQSLFGGINMKRSASELNLEEFLRNSPEIINIDDNQSFKEERIGEIRFQRAKICGGGEEEEEEADGFFADVHKSFEDVCAGDLSFGYRVRNTLNGFSSCGGMTDNFNAWSHNLNPRQSSISATMDSQSSICAGSPTSVQEPTVNGDNQVRGNTSGSSREQSDDDDLEAGTCEQSRDSIDLKRKRRMVSNRESARRSRRRKQEHLVELELQVDKLRGEHATLYKQLTDTTRQFQEAATDNRVFKSDVEALRVKVKLAEDMVARGTMTTYSLNNLLLNRSVSPQPLSSNNLSCISEMCSPNSGIQSDGTSSFIDEMSINGQIAALGLEILGGDHNTSAAGIIKNKINSCNNPPPLRRMNNGSLELPVQSRIVSDAAVSCVSESIWPWGSQVLPPMSKQI
ncbi:transcription factor RF2a-like [Macadamia integrifolia]|uniref:transcription factor RF2a-like n=1 Tax=Macadamia integrifolia TaxID=60698 RepID=UPI001C4F07FC|nr:transcription factor RF2a-like [Macadamia integrifolia]